MIDAPISAILTGILAGMLVMLSAPVSFRRIATKTSTGPGTDALLARLIRTQGNFVEYAPLGLFAIFMVEIGGAGRNTVCILSALLLAGRVIHAVAMMANVTIGRSIGMILTYASIVTSAVILLRRAI